MAYADKCFYFDWGDREIKLEDFDIYDCISVRSRYLPDDPECNSSTNHISIELWGRDKEDGSREEDTEIVLNRENALKLASKLIRAVHELDRRDALDDLYEDVSILKDIHSGLRDSSFQDEVDRRHRAGWSGADKKGGLGGALANYAHTPKGQDTLKKMKKVDETH